MSPVAPRFGALIIYKTGVAAIGPRPHGLALTTDTSQYPIDAVVAPQYSKTPLGSDPDVGGLAHTIPYFSLSQLDIIRHRLADVIEKHFNVNEAAKSALLQYLRSNNAVVSALTHRKPGVFELHIAPPGMALELSSIDHLARRPG